MPDVYYRIVPAEHVPQRTHQPAQSVPNPGLDGPADRQSRSSGCDEGPRRHGRGLLAGDTAM